VWWPTPSTRHLYAAHYNLSEKGGGPRLAQVGVNAHEHLPCHRRRALYRISKSKSTELLLKLIWSSSQTATLQSWHTRRTDRRLTGHSNSLG
jgi:hypothetical protein